jgi:hypothetical protein
MPLNTHFKGKGEQVMKSMVKEYGSTKGKSVFYATDNKRKSAKPKPKHSFGFNK